MPIELNGEQKSAILTLLKNGVVNVSFLKADGSVREMAATLCQTHLPARTEDEIKKAEEKGPVDYTATKSVPVFDTGIKEWRSFSWDKVLTMSVGKNEAGQQG